MAGVCEQGQGRPGKAVDGRIEMAIQGQGRPYRVRGSQAGSGKSAGSGMAGQKWPCRDRKGHTGAEEGSQGQGSQAESGMAGQRLP